MFLNYINIDDIAIPAKVTASMNGTISSLLVAVLSYFRPYVDCVLQHTAERPFNDRSGEVGKSYFSRLYSIDC